jgi:glucokinase
MFLAGDIGGTKTLLGLFEAGSARPQPFAMRAFATLDYNHLADMLSVFASEAGLRGGEIESACFGVAGPVVGESVQLTNVPWRIDAREVETALNIRRVRLLNDLQAMAHAIPVLQPGELQVLQEGSAPAGGHRALIAAGTGLGEASVPYLDGRYVPSPSEGGHADFAARTERDVAVWRDLVRQYGRAEVEQVVSGRGLVNLYRVTHARRCTAVEATNPRDLPAAITSAALERRCPECVETLAIFVEAYGAEAGNLALRTYSTGGLFVAGGIAPKILPALVDGRFIKAFCDKAPLADLMATIPVKVILNPEPGLLGAAVYATSS